MDINDFSLVQFGWQRDEWSTKQKINNWKMYCADIDSSGALCNPKKVQGDNL